MTHKSKWVDEPDSKMREEVEAFSTIGDTKYAFLEGKWSQSQRIFESVEKVARKHNEVVG